MTYEEFLISLKEPIDGKCDFHTETARLAVFSYALSTMVKELHDKVKILENENKELKDSLIHLQEYHGRELYEMKQFIKRNVEPDLSYMV